MGWRLLILVSKAVSGPSDEGISRKKATHVFFILNFIALTESLRGRNKGMDSIAEQSLERGFGLMSKKEYEVAVFNELINGSGKKLYGGKSDFELSLILKVPVSRIKTLRNEVLLRYEDIDTESLRTKCSLFLAQVEYRIKDDCVTFRVNDQMLKEYIQDFMEKHKKTFKYADDNFKMSIDAFKFFINENFKEREIQFITMNVPNTKNKSIGTLFREALSTVKDGTLVIGNMMTILSHTGLIP